MNSENTIVEVRGLTKWFDDIRAVSKIDLDIHAGRIYGLLGANASGKSTLLRHIVGMYVADEGKCTTFGQDAEKLAPDVLARIGYVHQEGELIDWMSVRQLLRYVSAYYPTWNQYI